MPNLLFAPLLLIAGPLVSLPAGEKPAAPPAAIIAMVSPAVGYDSVRTGKNISATPAATTRTTPPPRDRRTQPWFLFI